jgi:membrane protease YdiL (CAAX protease family)
MAERDASIHPQPWGYWATLGWALLVSGVSVIVTAVATLWWRPEILSEHFDPIHDGALLAFSTNVWHVVEIGALALVARLARWPAGKYLGLIIPSKSETALALACLGVFLVGFDGLTYLSGRDIVPPFQSASYISARDSGSLLLLWSTFVIFAPAGEEIMFRGFLFRGWVRSRRGLVPGVAIISALWASLHIQYDWFGLTQVFLMGVLFGWVRWRSGSTALTLLMHALANFWSTLETVAKVQGLS